MKKIILLAIIALLIAFPAIAWSDNNNDDNKEYPYESTSGTRYKYDLSNPSDRIRYEVDPGAQLRDSVNPRVDIDRGLGQYGGGSK